MSLDSVRAWIAQHAPDLEILQTPGDTATVATAAAEHGVEPDQIAKTLGFRIGDRELLLVASGATRIDNRKLRQAFGGKGRMLDAATLERLTGHPVGGICPFGLASDVPVYCDMSLRAWDVVMPAGGSINSAIAIAPQRLAELVGAAWVDVGKQPDVPTSAA